MKKLMLSFVLLSVSIIGNAQSQSGDKKKDEKEKGFKKENLFTGGSITLAFYTGGSTLGASPVFGYRLANWVDAGVVINYTHDSRRDYPVVDDKLRQSVYGGGVFTRLFPVNFLFAQAQFEHNFNRVNYIPSSSSPYAAYKETVQANSLLVGGGYTQGRQPGSNTFFYVAILFDVIKDENSPYVSVTSTGSTRANPIFRAGINIGLFEGGGRRGRYR